MFDTARTWTAPALVALILTTAACGSTESPTGPEAPSVPDVAGQWQGNADDTFDVNQDVQILLEQNGTGLSGTISSQIFRTDRIFPLSGSVDEDGVVRLTVAAADRGGCFDVSVDVTLSTSRRRLSGTYVIDRKAEGCGRRAASPPRRTFNLSR